MTAIEALHEEVSPTIDESKLFLQIVDGSPFSEYLEDPKDRLAFVAGINQFDQIIFDERNHNPNIWFSRVNGLHNRGTISGGYGLLRSSVVTEVLPEHPQFDQSAIKYYVGKFIIGHAGVGEIDTERYSARETRVVELILHLGKFVGSSVS